MVEKLYDKHEIRLAKKIGDVRDSGTKIVWRCNCGAKFDDHHGYAAHVNNCLERDRRPKKYCRGCKAYLNWDAKAKRYCEHIRC